VHNAATIKSGINPRCKPKKTMGLDNHNANANRGRRLVDSIKRPPAQPNKTAKGKPAAQRVPKSPSAQSWTTLTQVKNSGGCAYTKASGSEPPYQGGHGRHQWYGRKGSRLAVIAKYDSSSNTGAIATQNAATATHKRIDVRVTAPMIGDEASDCNRELAQHLIERGLSVG
jgi:hypothetical protein